MRVEHSNSGHCIVVLDMVVESEHEYMGFVIYIVQYPLEQRLRDESLIA